MKEVFCDIAVVGGGPAGLSAAAAAQNSGAENVILVEQKAEIPIETWSRPETRRKRTRHEVEGADASFRVSLEELRNSCQIKTTAVQLRGKCLLCIDPDGIVKIHFTALILAMGRSVGAPEELLKTVAIQPGFYTAAKDSGQMPKVGKEHKGVVILGSCDSSMLLARQLVQKGVSVRGIVEPRPEIEGLAENKARCLDRFQIPLYLAHAVIDSLRGNQKGSVTLAPVDSECRVQTEKAFVIPCDRLMDSKGKTPQTTDIILSAIPRDIRVNRLKQTQIPWIFACGDLVQPHEGEHQAAKDGTTAGHFAALYIKHALPNAWSGMEGEEKHLCAFDSSIEWIGRARR